MINHTIIATNDSFEMVWDEEEKEYQIIRKGDRRVRERGDDEEKIAKLWNLGYADEDSKIEPNNEQSVFNLKIGDQVQVVTQTWLVTGITPDHVVFLTPSGCYCKLNQQIVLKWSRIN